MALFGEDVVVEGGQPDGDEGLIETLKSEPAVVTNPKGAKARLSQYISQIYFL